MKMFKKNKEPEQEVILKMVLEKLLSSIENKPLKNLIEKTSKEDLFQGLEIVCEYIEGLEEEKATLSEQLYKVRTTIEGLNL